MVTILNEDHEQERGTIDAIPADPQPFRGRGRLRLGVAVACSIAVVALGPGVALAADVIAATCEAADVQAALDAAEPGDVVHVPAGDCLWTESVVVGQAVHLRGAGAGRTNIAKAGGGPILLVGADTAPDRLLRVSGFAFDGRRSVTCIRWNERRIPAFRIDHNTFVNCVERAIEIEGYQSGVIDHNAFQDNGRSDIVVYGDDEAAWARPAVLGGYDGVVFVEDNTFTYTADATESEQSVSSNAGARLVIRHNTIEAAFVASDVHVAAPVHLNGHCFWRRGTVSYEIYGNVIRSARSFRGIFLSGGTGVVFDNVFLDDGDGCPVGGNCFEIPIALTNHRSCQSCAFGGACDAYPCLDQIQDLYVWDNTLEGAPVVPVVAACASDHVALDRDYFVAPRPGYAPHPHPHPHVAADGADRGVVEADGILPAGAAGEIRLRVVDGDGAGVTAQTPFCLTAHRADDAVPSLTPAEVLDAVQVDPSTVCGRTALDGTATLVLVDTRAGQVALSAETPALPGVLPNEDAEVVIRPGEPHGLRLSLDGSPAPVCGEVTVSARLVDAFGNPIVDPAQTEQVVTFEAVSADWTPRIVATTLEDAALVSPAEVTGTLGVDGAAGLVLAMDAPGSVEIRWWGETLPADASDENQVTVDFVLDAASPSGCPGASPEETVVVPATGTVEACAAGGAFLELTVILRDAAGEPLPPWRAPVVVADPPWLIPGPASAATGDGVTVHTLAVGADRCGPEPRLIALEVDGAPLGTGPVVIFTCPDVDPASTSFVADPDAVPADGETRARVAFGLVDVCGQPAFDRDVTVSVTRRERDASVVPDQPRTADAEGTEADGVAVVEIAARVPGRSGLRLVVDGVAVESDPELLAFLPVGHLALTLTTPVQQAVAGQRVPLTATLENGGEAALVDVRLEADGAGLRILLADGAALEGGSVSLGRLEAGAARTVRLDAVVEVGAAVAIGRIRVDHRVETFLDLPAAPVFAEATVPVAGGLEGGGCDCRAGAGGTGPTALVFLALGLAWRRSLRPAPPMRSRAGP